MRKLVEITKKETTQIWIRMKSEFFLKVLSFLHATVKKIMTSKTVLFTMEKTTILDSAKILEISDERVARIPIYDSKEDQIIRVLYA